MEPMQARLVKLEPPHWPLTDDKRWHPLLLSAQKFHLASFIIIIIIVSISSSITVFLPDCGIAALFREMPRYN